MLKALSFKLASRIVCLAVLMSAALWLNAPVHASFTCVISQNNNTGSMAYISCGSSVGDTLWACGGGSCTSNPDMDGQAGNMCANAAANGCPEPVYYFD